MRNIYKYTLTNSRNNGGIIMEKKNHHLEVFRQVLISHGEQLIKLQHQVAELKKSKQHGSVSEEIEDLIHSNKNALIVLTEVMKDKSIILEKDLHKKYMELMSGYVPEPMIARKTTKKTTTRVITRKSRKKSDKVTLPKSDLSYTICKRFFKNAGAGRVGDDALLSYNKLLINVSKNISKKALQISKARKSKKLEVRDLRDAYEEILKNTQLPPEGLDVLERFASEVEVKTLKKTAKKSKPKISRPKKKVKPVKAKPKKKPARKQALKRAVAVRKVEIVPIEPKKPKKMTETSQTLTTTRTVKELK